MSLPRSLRPRALPAVATALAAALALAPAALAGGESPPPKGPPPPTDVALAKTSDAETYEPGDVVTYTLTVTNTGQAPVARARIVVSDPSLADLAPVGATTGTLQPGESTLWIGTRTLTAAECGTLVNEATVALASVKGGAVDSVPGNDSATRTVTVGGEACTPVVTPASVTPQAVVPASVTPPAPPAKPSGTPVCIRPRLSALLTGPRYPTPGTTAGFLVTVRAAGARADRVSVRIVVPPGFFVPGRASTARLRGGALVVGVGSLRAGGSRSIPFRLRLVASARGPRTVKASVSATCGAAATATTTVRPVAVRPVVVQPAVTG